MYTFTEPVSSTNLDTTNTHTKLKHSALITLERMDHSMVAAAAGLLHAHLSLSLYTQPLPHFQIIYYAFDN